MISPDGRLPLLDAIARGPLLLDAAMGTRLMARGLDLSRDDPALWNLDHPEAVVDIHARDVAAGSDALLTNTFGANRRWLARYGRDEDVASINRAAVHLARRAAGPDRYVLGSIGPTAAPDPDAYREQAAALIEAGVDALLLETHSIEEAVLHALPALRSVVFESELVPPSTPHPNPPPQGGRGPETSFPTRRIGCRLPPSPLVGEGQGGGGRAGTSPPTHQVLILVSLRATDTLDIDGARRLIDLGASALGANCLTGFGPMLELARRLRPSIEVPLLAKPNAGPPDRPPIDPNSFADAVPELLDLGVRLIGGCCATTEAHVAALRHRLDSARRSVMMG